MDIDIMIREFFEKSKIRDKDETESYDAAEKILRFLMDPETVVKMTVAADMGVPVLTPIVKVLEDEYDTAKFPLNTNGEGANAKYRRNVGWMIRHVMMKHGYVPADQPSIQNRIPRIYIPGNEKDEMGQYVYPKYFIYGAKYRKMSANEQLKYQQPTLSVKNVLIDSNSKVLIE